MKIVLEFGDYEEMEAFCKKVATREAGSTAPLALSKEEPKKSTKKTEPKAEKAEEPVQEKVETVAEEPKSDAKESKSVAIEDVREVLGKVQKKNKDALREILTGFGARNLTSVDPADYSALIEKAGEYLGGGADA